VDPGRRGEFPEEKVPFGARPARSLGVVPLFGLGEVGIEFGEAAPVLGERPGIEDVVGGRTGDRVLGRTGWRDACWRGAGWRGAGELGDVERGQFPAGVADQQIEVAQANAVWQPGHRARVPHRPVIALALHRHGAGRCGLLFVQDRRELGHAALGGDGAGLAKRLSRAGEIGTGGPGG